MIAQVMIMVKMTRMTGPSPKTSPSVSLLTVIDVEEEEDVVVENSDVVVSSAWELLPP